jgi:DNA-directed RNA polymerase specialized sigma24 family protein
MTAKELLKACRYAVQEIAAIQRQMDATCFPVFGGCKGVIITDMPHGTNDPTTAVRQALDHYEELLEQAKQEKAGLLEEFERMMKTVDDTFARVILRHYYGAGRTDEQIAIEMDKARETVTRRRNAAENFLQNTFIPSQNVIANHRV